MTTEITNAALRLNGQVENLLNTSRLEAGFIQPKFEWCDVNELIYNTLQKLEKDLAAHKTDIEIDENMPLVKLDYGLMEQVLANLIGNAANYTPEKTVISIKAYLTKHHESSISDKKTDNDAIATDLVTHKLKIEIADTGKSIPLDKLETIFMKFYRLEKTQPVVTGLGLFITRGFVEAQGGIIKAMNLLNSGALFIIDIPTIILPQTIHHE